MTEFVTAHTQRELFRIVTQRKKNGLPAIQIRRGCWVCSSFTGGDNPEAMAELNVNDDVVLYLCQKHYYATLCRDHPMMMVECFFHHDDEGCTAHLNGAKPCQGGGRRKAGMRWTTVANYIQNLQKFDSQDEWERYSKFLRQIEGTVGVISVDYKGDVIQ